MNKKKIAVLFGGCSAEYTISLQSAYAVIAHINRDKYEPILLGITQDGRWLRYSGPLDALLNDTWHCLTVHCVPAVISPDRQLHGILLLSPAGPGFIRLDAAFPILHGKNGEDGTIQGLLELAGIPIIGCNTLPSALCMDKDVAHRLAAEAGIAVPNSIVYRSGEDMHLLLQLASKLTYPLFVKPARSGSSFGVSRITSAGGLGQAVEDALRYDNKVIIEEEIAGFEVGCAIMGTQELTLGAVDEIELQGSFFDYTEKYNLITSRIHMPARISKNKAEEIRQTAAHLYRVLECSGFVRADFFLTSDGTIYFNEINTIPGFTDHSRFPNMMKGVGIDFPSLLEKLMGQVVSI